MPFFDQILAGFKAEKVPYALVGGWAVALHGAPRGTVDIDFIIQHTEQDFVACERALRGIGLVPRLPVTASEVYQFRREYIDKRNLIAWSFVNPSHPIEVVDIVITHDLATLTSVTKNYGLEKIRILALEPLIAMKRLAGRPQDLEDIHMLELIRDREKRR